LSWQSQQTQQNTPRLRWGCGNERNHHARLAEQIHKPPIPTNHLAPLATVQTIKGKSRESKKECREAAKKGAGAGGKAARKEKRLQSRRKRGAKNTAALPRRPLAAGVCYCRFAAIFFEL